MVRPYPWLYMGGQKSVLRIYIFLKWCHVKYLGSNVNAYNTMNLEGLMLCSCVHQFNAFPELLTAPRGEGFYFATQTIFSPISSDKKRSSVNVGAHHRFPVKNLVSCLVCWYCSFSGPFLIMMVSSCFTRGYVIKIGF